MDTLLLTRITSWTFQIRKRLFYALYALGLLAAMNSCDDDDAATGTRIQLKNDATLANIFTDRSGRTLYYFAHDATTANTCTGDCDAFWPSFTLDNFTEADIPEGVSFSDFSTITTASGKSQVTFKGRPLYYYAPLSGSKNQIEAA